MKTVSLHLIIISVFFVSCGDGPASDTSELEGASVLLVDDISDLELSTDVVTVDRMTTDNNILILDLSYTGGCNTHAFTLYAEKGVSGPGDLIVPSVLEHKGNGDPCEERIETRIFFDLDPLIDHMRSNNNGLETFRLQVFNSWSTAEFGIIRVAVP